MKKSICIAAAMLLISMGGFAQQPAAAKTAAKPHAAAKKAATVAAAPAATATAAADPAPTTAVVETFLKRMFGYNENVAFHVASVKPSDAHGLSEVIAVVSTPQGQQILKFYVTADGDHAIIGELMPFGTDPFAKDRAILKKEAFGAAKGPADAPMQIVEFADLECPACKSALPLVQRLQQDFPHVRFVFQSFPLVKLHPWAEAAARTLDCISRQSNEAGWTFIEAVYSHQGEITEANLKEKLEKYVGFAKQDPAKIAACSQTPETIARIQQSIQIGDQLNVSSTPTLFVNGRGVNGMNPQEYDAIKAIVQFELSQATQAK